MGAPDLYERFIRDNTLDATWDTLNDAQRVASALNDGNFVLEATVDGGTVTFPDNQSIWILRPTIRGPYGIEFGVWPSNQQARDLFVQPDVFDLFDEGIRITDRTTGDTITGPNTRDPEWSPLDDPGDGHLDFQDPRVFRLGAKIEF